MERRPLGKTNENLSIVGFGGIVVTGVDQTEANRYVAEAIDRGINYFDVAPSYGDAEDRLGPALEPYRSQVFLACKTGKRTKKEAAEELRNSLKRLRTDHFDLYQFHALSTKEEMEQVFGPEGALEAFLEARDQGLIRYIGFSSHSVETALELLDRFPFDSILFPINYVLYYKAGFGPQVVEKAVQKEVGRLALKTMAKTHWAEGEERGYPKCWYHPITDPREASMALRFTLSQPITAAIPPGDIRLFRLAMEVAENFTPITQEEVEELKAMAQNLKPIFELASSG